MKLLIAVTGASGSIYAKCLFKLLEKRTDIETMVVFSKEAESVWEYELEETSYKSLPFKKFLYNDFFAPPASGSSQFDAMIICPCSMGTLGRIASGTSDNLIIRAADVMLKEKRKLILVTRETPLNLIHIRNMETICLAGGIVFPASPGFYQKPQTLNEVIEHTVIRILNISGVENDGFRWG